MRKNRRRVNALKIIAIFTVMTTLLALGASVAAVMTPGINVPGAMEGGGMSGMNPYRREGDGNVDGNADDNVNGDGNGAGGFDPDTPIDENAPSDGAQSNGNAPSTDAPSDAYTSDSTESVADDSLDSGMNEDPLDRPADEITSAPSSDTTAAVENDASAEAEGGIGVWGIIIAILIVAAVVLLIFAFLPK